MLASRLDEVIGAGHPVRFLVEIFARLDWSKWEAGSDLTRGQPPIHPRVLVGVLLSGLLRRTRIESGVGRGAVGAARFSVAR